MRPVLAGGLACGAFDLTFAFIYYGAEFGVKPERIMQSIASGLLGARAFEGGVITAALGVLLHFDIACAIALVFCLAARAWTALTRWAITSGIVYGAIVYFVMKWIVTPLSAVPMRSYPPPIRSAELIAHMLLVGLPVALAARRWLRPR